MGDRLVMIRNYNLPILVPIKSHSSSRNAGKEVGAASEGMRLFPLNPHTVVLLVSNDQAL